MIFVVKEGALPAMVCVPGVSGSRSATQPCPTDRPVVPPFRPKMLPAGRTMFIGRVSTSFIGTGWPPAAPVMRPSRPAAGPGVGHRRVDRDLAGVGAEVQRRLVTLSVVQGEVRDRAVGGQVVAVAGMPVAVSEREVGACDLDADPMASREVVRGCDANDLDPVDLAGHELGWLLEAVAVAEPQATVGEVVGGPVRINVHELDE